MGTGLELFFTIVACLFAAAALGVIGLLTWNQIQHYRRRRRHHRRHSAERDSG